MSKILSHLALFLRNLKTSTIVMALALLPLTHAAYADDAKPTAADISKARADCAKQKQTVRTLESATNVDEAQLSVERLAWEHACGYAQNLMNAASGAKAPAVFHDPNAAAAAAPADSAPPNP